MADEITHASGYTGQLASDAPEGTPGLPLIATGQVSTWTGVDPADRETVTPLPDEPPTDPPTDEPPVDAPGA